MVMGSPVTPVAPSATGLGSILPSTNISPVNYTGGKAAATPTATPTASLPAVPVAPTQGS
jgi:hypothetical protein